MANVLTNRKHKEISIKYFKPGEWFILAKDLNNPDRDIYFLQPEYGSTKVATKISNSGEITLCVIVTELVIPIKISSFETKIEIDLFEPDEAIGKD